MIAKITVTAYVEVTQAGLDSLKAMDSQVLISKLDTAGVGEALVVVDTSNEHPTSDEWDDEYCDVATDNSESDDLND